MTCLPIGWINCGKAARVDMDYVVGKVLTAINDDCVALQVSAIENNRIMENDVAQIFGTDGKVAVGSAEHGSRRRTGYRAGQIPDY